MSTVDTLHIYVDTDLKYRWSYVAGNGPILADSGQGYADIRNCRRGFSILNRHALSPMPLYTLDDCARHASVTCQVWQIRRTDDHTDAAEALRRFTPKCPIHGDHDADGCRLVEYLRNQLELAAQEHDKRSTR